MDWRKLLWFIIPIVIAIYVGAKVFLYKMDNRRNKRHKKQTTSNLKRSR